MNVRGFLKQNGFSHLPPAGLRPLVSALQWRLVD